MDIDDTVLMDHYYELASKDIYDGQHFWDALSRKIWVSEFVMVQNIDQRVHFLLSLGKEMMTDDEKYHHDNNGRYYDDDWGYMDDDGQSDIDEDDISDDNSYFSDY